MASTLLNRFQRSLEQSQWFRPGERVGVAVSGGADSIALLLLLRELQKPLGIVLSIVHFNHKIRGRASDADERAVASLAGKLNLQFHIARENVPAKARREKANLEDAARRARYDFFSQLVTQKHVDKIAVAHTADDQAETVLAHILRGSGLAGLGGIHPTADHIVRPLLEFRRAELRAYLRSEKQTWREDATNRDVNRLRARIRRKLLPLLEKQFQPEIVPHLATLSELAREDERFLDALAQETFQKLVTIKDDSASISCRDLLDCGTTKQIATADSWSKQELVNSALSRRIIRLLVKRVKPRAGQLSSQHVEAVLELARRNQGGKRLPLPGGVDVRLEAGTLTFSPASRGKHNTAPSRREFSRTLTLNGSETHISVPELSCVFRFRVIDWPFNTSDTIDKRSVLDRDALSTPLVLRSWRPGDRFRPLGHRSAHKLKDLLSRLRITGDQRHGWPVLTAGDQIVWCRGLPVAAEVAANERTRSGLVIFEDDAS